MFKTILKGHILFSTLATLLVFSSYSFASDNSFLQSVKQTLSDTWDSPTHELYIPANTWHNRAAYSRSKVDSYNERPWGIGYGVTRFDEDGDWHALYIMEFQDSHNVVEPIGG